MADGGNASLPNTDTTVTSVQQAAAEDDGGKKSKGLAAWFSSKKNQDGKDGDVKPEEKTGPPPVPFLQLFRYANSREKIFVVIANLAAAGHGAIMPAFTIIFGDIVNSFGAPAAGGSLSSFFDVVGDKAIIFFYLGIAAFVTSFLQIYLQIFAANSICSRIRRLYFESVLRQDATWYDENKTGEVTARISGDVDIIQNGIGDKIPTAVQFVVTFIVGIIIAFIYHWRLTLVILSVSPLLLLCGAAFGQITQDATSDGLGAYGRAGAIASEALGLIRIVTGYGGQEEESRRYEAELDNAYAADSKKALLTGVFLGLTMCLIMWVYGLAFYTGFVFLQKNRVDAGNILTCFFSVLISTVSLGQAAPSFTAFAAARGAAPVVYEIIDRQSGIDPLNDNEGQIIGDFQGNIEFKNVAFNYKSRVVDTEAEGLARSMVLEDFNLSIPAGESHALVGPSGCGKSTTVRLVERFYDVSGGQVLFDGRDVKDLNVRWLRSQIGYVGQMPTLFMMTIRENIALGAALDSVADTGTGKVEFKRKDVTQDDIIEAAKKANAHNFIMKLPEQYDTMLGERGAMLSGGQKQRVCIARALVRNPKILILDESTAALDAQSEAIVQEALENASQGRTTITIAHRLSTVKNCDQIRVLDKGHVVESGTHTELFAKDGGVYNKLVELQNIVTETKIGGADHEDISMPTMVLNKSGDAALSTSADRKTVYSKDQSQYDILDAPESDLPAVDKGVITRAFKMNAGEWPYMAAGIIGSAFTGATWPVLSYLFAKIIVLLSTPGSTYREIGRWSGGFVGIGIVAFIAAVFQHGGLGYGGEKLTRRIRSAAFRQLMKQNMAFFDEQENSVGALSTRLALEATLVKGLTGDITGGLVLVLSTLGVGLIIAFASCWPVALIVLTMVPAMGFAGYLQMKMMAGFDSDSQKEFAASGAVAAEATDNIDAVSAVGVQDVWINKYTEELQGPLQKGKKSAFVGGVAFGISEFLSQALWAVSFWGGAAVIRNGRCGTGQNAIVNFMAAISALLFAGMSIGQASLFMPDMAKARVAATNLFRLLDRKSKIDPTAKNWKSLDSVAGEVQTSCVKFEYPSRPDIPVLRGLEVAVEPGKTLALVGESGCGKSTIVSLLERFYDPRTGTITLDGSSIKDVNLQNLRSHMSLVSQEPDLFDRSVRDNIAYGLSHEDGTPVSEDVIIEAAKTANAHNFIMELPEGYDTIVGPRGNRLSGGQKQRVAIARALVRNPRLLLLDEATSALDAESERIVQDALDAAASGRTTIAIAHRLSTIKDADSIAVIARGKVAELGTHEELLQKNGKYAQLVRNQMSEKMDA